MSTAAAAALGLNLRLQESGSRSRLEQDPQTQPRRRPRVGDPPEQRPQLSCRCRLGRPTTASTAVVKVLTPICVEKFMQNRDAQANLAALREISSSCNNLSDQTSPRQISVRALAWGSLINAAPAVCRPPRPVRQSPPELGDKLWPQSSKSWQVLKFRDDTRESGEMKTSPRLCKVSSGIHCCELRSKLIRRLRITSIAGSQQANENHQWMRL